MNNKETYFKYLTELTNWGGYEASTAPAYLARLYPELTEAQAVEIIKEWNATKNQLLNETSSHMIS